MTGLKPWPIVAGILTDLLGSVVVGVAYVLVFLGLHLARGEAADIALETGHWIMIEILGLLLTGIGGFVAGRMARAQHVRHGCAAGVGSAVVWLMLEAISGGGGAAAWYEVVSFVAMVPAAGLGGYAARRVGVSPLPPIASG